VKLSSSAFVAQLRKKFNVDEPRASQIFRQLVAEGKITVTATAAGEELYSVRWRKNLPNPVIAHSQYFR
jgi:hypothetical protein